MVLLDAAAYAPTNPLDLRAYKPDFVAVSFYKMFGFPTGLGCLLVRAETLEEMRDVYWGGGQVALATAGRDFRALHCQPSERFEDGTLPYLDIAGLKHGFRAMEVREPSALSEAWVAQAGGRAQNPDLATFGAMP